MSRRMKDNDEWLLIKAAEIGDVEEVRRLISAGVDVRDGRGVSSDNRMAIRTAARMGRLHVVKLLLEKDAEVNAMTYGGNTPLSVAVQAGHLEVVELLLKKGANANNIDTYGALNDAASMGHLNVVKLLLENGFDVNKGSWGTRALCAATSRGHLNVVKVLLENGADVDWGERNWGFTPLHCAVWWGDLDFVELFLERRADVNAKDNKGRTALHWALYKHHSSIVEPLLAAGAYVNAKDDEGTTALHWAVDKHHSSIVELLLAAGAYVNAKDNRGKTPLLDALKREQCYGGSEMVSIVNSMLERGAGIIADENGLTAIDVAAIGRELDVDLICKMLLPSGALVTLAQNVLDAHAKRQQRIERALVQAVESPEFVFALAHTLTGIDASGSARGPGTKLRTIVQQLEKKVADGTREQGPAWAPERWWQPDTSRTERLQRIQPALAWALQSPEFRSNLADMLACELDNVSGPASPLTALARQLCAAAKDNDGAREPAAAGAPKRRRVGAA